MGRAPFCFFRVCISLMFFYEKQYFSLEKNKKYSLFNINFDLYYKKSLSLQLNNGIPAN
jgi:hypothetical protein